MHTNWQSVHYLEVSSWTCTTVIMLCAHERAIIVPKQDDDPSPTVYGGLTRGSATFLESSASYYRCLITFRVSPFTAIVVTVSMICFKNDYTHTHSFCTVSFMHRSGFFFSGGLGSPPIWQKFCLSPHLTLVPVFGPRIVSPPSRGSFSKIWKI